MARDSRAGTIMHTWNDVYEILRCCILRGCQAALRQEDASRGESLTVIHCHFLLSKVRIEQRGKQVLDQEFRQIEIVWLK